MGICASKPQVEKAQHAAQGAAQHAASSVGISPNAANVLPGSGKDGAAAPSSLGDMQPGGVPGSPAAGATSLSNGSVAPYVAAAASPKPTGGCSPGAADSIPDMQAAAAAAAAAGATAGATSAVRPTAECTSPSAQFTMRSWLSAPPAAPPSESALLPGTGAAAAEAVPANEAVVAADASQSPAEESAMGTGAAAAAAAVPPPGAAADVAAGPVGVAGQIQPNNGVAPHSAFSFAPAIKSAGQPRSVKFADRPPLPTGSHSADEASDAAQRAPRVSWGAGLTPAEALPRAKKRIPGRSHSNLTQGSRGPTEEQLNEAVLAKQVEILRSNKMGKLRQRRGGLDSSFAAMQEALAQDEKSISHVNTRAAGLKHIGFGPFKRENQDEFFIQVGEFGGLHSSNLFCVFDGHGTHGKDAALYSRQLLPRLLDVELTKYFQRVNVDSDEGLKGAVEVLITEVFGETERSLSKFGVNLASSGTTASVTYQKGNRLWVASAGDSRAILCSRMRDQWRALPLTIDHRPRRESERERIEAAGARVAPKRLPSGRTVGEPRMWLQNASGPGLLLSRSLGDLTAATVGCTSDPEVSFTTLRPGVDHVLVMATDGVWDVLTNEQVCDIVVESPDPHIACRRVLDAALYEWEERMSADNITVLVVEFDWGEEGSSLSVNSLASMEQAAHTSSGSNRLEEPALNAAAMLPHGLQC